jgi:phage tail sheath protein FI
MTEPVFGITFTRDDTEARPVVASDMSVIGLVGTAGDAIAETFPLNTPVAMSSNDPILLAQLGTDGTLPDALAGINAQLGEFQVAARVVVVRVAEGENEAATIANLIGNQGSQTGLYALWRAGPDLGVIPRLIGVPGYTHQRVTVVASVTITNQGSGYTSAPTVAFAGGGGTGAAGTAVLGTGDDAEKVVSITITNPGSGYTSAPTVSFSGGSGTGAAGTAVIESLANAVCAALPAVCEKLLAHAVVEGPGTNNTAIIDWRETIQSQRLIPTDLWARIQEGTEVVTRPSAPRVLGIGVRRDYEKRGVPGHSWANQPIQGILGFARSVDFSLTDGATAGQVLLAANVGIGVRGQMGVESAIASGGFVFIGTDNAGEDELWRFYSQTRLRDYIHLGLLRVWRYYLGRYNIGGQAIQAVLNSGGFWLRDLKADGHILGYELGFERAKNSPENLRAGRFRCYFAAEEPAPLRRLDTDSRRYRPALDATLDSIIQQSSDLIAG